MAGVAKEIWTDQLMENMYAEASFLDFAQDMTQYVDNNTINLAEAGIDPVVYVNNSVWPIPTVQREDNPIAIPLDTFDTENTLVRNVEEKESSYDKMESVLKGHRRSLRRQSLQRAAHAYSPQSNTPLSPILTTTGAVVTESIFDANGNKTGEYQRRRLTWDDVARMKTAMTLLEAEGVFCAVLHPLHVLDLRKEDREFHKQFATLTPGGTVAREGFMIMEYPKTAVYASAGTKKAYGAVVNMTTDLNSSFCFMENEVMKADGTVEMFLREKDPDQRGDIVGFQKRFKALPLRYKYIGAWIDGKPAA